MRRVHYETANQDYGPYRTGNLFAGSVIFLQSGVRHSVTIYAAAGSRLAHLILLLPKRQKPPAFFPDPSPHSA